MYSKLKENDRYEYILKDCSFGGKYPVAALIILEKNTGKYGIKLGCHPDLVLLWKEHLQKRHKDRIFINTPEEVSLIFIIVV